MSKAQTYEVSKAQAYLEKIKKYDTLVENKMIQIKKLDDMQTHITATMKEDVVAFSPAQDKLGENVGKFLDLESKLYLEIDYYLERIDEATALIDKMKDPDHVNVLYKRYVLYWKFDRIAKKMHCSERNVYNNHDKALQAFEKLLTRKQAGE